MNATRGSKSSSNFRPIATRLAAIAIFIFAGYLIADTATLWSRQYMLPTQPPPAKPKQPNGPPPMVNYTSITTRNIFNSDGVIPEPMIAKAGNRQKELPPIASQLPLTLVGTLVHSNPEKSLAALEIKGKNSILSFRPTQQIENLATLEKVERMKIYIRNLNSGRLEFVEMKNAPKTILKTAAKAPTGGGDVKRVSETEFEIKRGDLMKYTSDLSSVLMQARVLPARRANGDIYGYRLVEVQPNSIYTQLGLGVGDVLTAVNGTPVTSPQQAMEMYTTLRNSNKVKLGVEQNGRTKEMTYNIAN